MHVRDLEAARRIAQAAVTAAQDVGAGELEADALITLGTAEAYIGDQRRALDALRAGLERAEELGIAETALRGHINSRTCWSWPDSTPRRWRRRRRALPWRPRRSEPDVPGPT